MPQQTRRYATIQTAADYLNVSARTVRRLIADGTITGYRLGPRLIRVDLNQVDESLWVIPSAGSRR